MAGDEEQINHVYCDNHDCYKTDSLAAHANLSHTFSLFIQNLLNIHFKSPETYV